jgi:hypothetical protein
MKIYDSFGTFDDVKKNFKLAIQTTVIGFDEYYISEYYDICNTERYAIVAILQTKLKNDTDLSACKENCGCIVSDIDFSSLNKDFWVAEDKKINDAVKGDTINIIVHHAIGFDPNTNADDKKYIENYKAGIYTHLTKGAPPGAHGTGVAV